MKVNKVMKAVLLSVLLGSMLAACASPGAQPGTDSPAAPAEETPVVEQESDAPYPEPQVTEEPVLVDTGAPVDAVIADLSSRLQIPETEIEVVSAEAVEWPDGGIGCPLPGFEYTQAVVPGFLIVLQAGGETYDYHTDEDQERAVLCAEDGMPALPPILDKDGPQDGEPWIPVD